MRKYHKLVSETDLKFKVKVKVLIQIYFQTPLDITWIIT